jgi:succinate dehydrogenase / fumarate reductase iron-sulfur subunit
MTDKTIKLKVKRQDFSESKPYWQEFDIPYRSYANVISCLQEVQENPTNASGKIIKPVVWDCNCLEEVCGSCTMIINGKVRQACTALIDNLEKPIILEPLTKFPVIRDLQVDRSRMFENLKKVKAWIEIDGTHDIGEGPIIQENQRSKAYVLSECMTCGCCLEACPQFTLTNNFMGASTMSQVRLFNMHPTGAVNKEDRLEEIMQEGGIADCGNAQVCVEVCPKKIPLTESIAEIGRQTTWHLLKKLLLK